MDPKTKRYLRDVMSHLGSLDTKTRQRLREDLLTQITEASMDQDLDTVLSELGDPKTLAQGYLDLERPAGPRPWELGYEYRSRTQLWGLPLVHVCFRSGRGLHGNVAKGIIAIAPVAFGLVAIGPLACGFLALGAISVGLVAMGGIALGLILAIGAIAIGIYALGAVAIGYLVRGVEAAGHTAIGETARGVHALQGETLTRDQIRDFLFQHHPNLRSWLVWLFSLGT